MIEDPRQFELPLANTTCIDTTAKIANNFPFLVNTENEDVYTELYKGVAAGAQRMSANAYKNGINSYSDALKLMYEVPQITMEMLQQTPFLWVTDKPEEIFGMAPFYTVTSARAYQSLLEGNYLRPPMLLEQFGIKTHRGAALPLMTRIFESFQMFVEKDYAVWAGAKIDSEQVLLENSVAQNSAETQKRLINTLFNQYQKWNGATYFEAKRNLVELYERIYTGRKVTKNSGLEEYIIKLETAFTDATGTRDGWLNIFDGILKGQIDRTSNLGMTKAHFEIAMLEFQMNSISTDPVDPSEVAVLEMDPRVIYERVGKGVMFPLVPRKTPVEFFPSPLVTQEAINFVYKINPSKRELKQDVRIRDILEIPRNKFLGGIRPEEIKKIDMFNPTCAIRYQGESPQQIWMNNAIAGRIAPIYAKNWTKPLPGVFKS